MIKQPTLYRPNWVEINLGNARQNIRSIAKHLSPGAKIMPVIKDNAYGHGSVEFAKALLKEKSVWGFGVASLEEAVTLRDNGINSPVLLLGAFYPFDYLKDALKYKVTPTITSVKALRHYSKFANKAGRTGRFHLKVDTGMGRIGLRPGELDGFIEKLRAHKNLVMEGVFTHFSSADSSGDHTKFQIREFGKVIEDIKKAGLNSVLFHAANSAGIMKFHEAHFSLVRPGLAIYGLLPFADSQKYVATKPILSWKTRIADIRYIPKGMPVSYSRTFITKRDSLIAVLPAGYGDGYNRLLSNRGYVKVGNKTAPVAGRVTMDLTMVDVTGLRNVKVGDEVTLLGSGVSAEDIAGLCSTISYEITCNINSRVPRIYSGETC